MDPEPYIFRNDGEIPNNPMLPVLFYKAAVTSPDKATYFENTFQMNGWGGTWRNVIFDYHHFHPNAHEALGIASGRARIQLGGRNGRVFEVEEGDMLILPAGTGHINLDSSGDFVVVGAYPAGQENYDICKSLEESPEAPERIEKVALPKSDPLFGEDGPLTTLWQN